MARYDKYDPISGGFRAALEADLPGDGTTGEFGPVAVSLNTAGRVVVGTAGASGLVGVLVKNAPRMGAHARGGRTTTLQGEPNPNAWIGQKAGDVVDIMTSGEIVDFDGFNPGDPVYAAADGTLSAVATGNIKVGFIAGSGPKRRMVIRVAA